MKYFFIMLFMLVSASSHAQMFSMKVEKETIDSIRYWVVYKDNFYPYVEKKQMYEERRLLVVGDSISNYNYLTNWYPEIMMQVKSDPQLSQYTTKEDMLNFLFSDALPTKGRKIDFLLKGYPKNGMLRYRESLGIPTPYYDEELPKLEWTTLEGDSTIIDYQCFKAKTTFRGRTWTVWYTLDIPVSDGPWKLCGLPGLILQAEESTGHHVITAIGVGKAQNKEIITVNKNFGRKTTLKDITKRYLDPKVKSFVSFGSGDNPDKPEEKPGEPWLIEECE